MDGFNHLLKKSQTIYHFLNGGPKEPQIESYNLAKTC